MTVEEVPVPYSTVPVPVQYCVLKDYAPDCLDAPAQDVEGGVYITRLLLPVGVGEEGRNLDAVHHRQNNYKIKTPNPKCRLYWCLIEFIDWRYSPSCYYFRPL